MTSDGCKIAEFPDVENKLQAPTKKSLFERQRAEAEAKRRKEEQETKAVYEDFVKSFDDEDDVPLGGGRFGGGGLPLQRRQFAGGGGFSVPSGPSGGRGYGGPPVRSSGPGSLGPPPSSLNKKRTFDGFQQQQYGRRDDRGVFAYDDYGADRERESKRVFQTSDDEAEDTGRAVDRGEEKAAAKPTLQLSSLPPGTSPAVIKALIPKTLTVDSVRIAPPSGPGSASERRSTTAIVTLSKDTPANDIDTAVNQLQNRYLGFGYYLSLHRHLSSAAISSNALPSASNTTSAQISHPFGAKAVSLAQDPNRAPPPHNSRFAPPKSYGPPLPGLGNGPLLHVPVQPPSSIKTLKAIHKTIELLLTHGPEFEALLLTRLVVQKSEHWAWIWDARSAGGVYYRWRLWSILTSSKSKGRFIPLFEGSHAWKAPEKEHLPWEYTTQLSEFVSDSEYNSSDEDDSDNEASRPPARAEGGEEENAYLTPISKAKLTHLLARLPASTSLLRKGDVARVTAFAISHAGRGADEVVNMLVRNVIHPFSITSANPNYAKAKPNDPNTEKTYTTTQEDTEQEDKDHSSSQMIALYLISDILSSSSTSGVRHAWRYRSLFESCLKSHNAFAKLGRLERDLKWGRLRGEKWKRSVGNLLGLWEGWCVFTQDAMEGFRTVFENPPKTSEEEEDERKREEEKENAKAKSRWKALEKERKDAMLEEGDVDGVPMEDEDVDGEPMDEEDVDGEPMEDDDIDGQAMLIDEVEPPEAEVQTKQPTSAELLKRKVAEAMARGNAASTGGGGGGGGGGGVVKKPRLTAADMFADSDEE